jgi:hypothetical protein
LKEESSIIDENDTMMDLVVDFNVDHEIWMLNNIMFYVFWGGANLPLVGFLKRLQLQWLDVMVN